MGPILYEIVGPDMVGIFWPQAGRRTRLSAKAGLFCPFLRDFKPFAPTDPLDALLIYVPASIVQKARDHVIAVAARFSFACYGSFGIVSILLRVAQVLTGLFLRPSGVFVLVGSMLSRGINLLLPLIDNTVLFP
jgi:hypothetical protein